MPLPPSERERDVWDDILTNARAAADVTAGLTFEAFAAGLRTNDAVVRRLGIVPEASRRLRPETRAGHPQIPWRDIADAGTFYRHSYHEVALDIVWRTVHERLPALAAAAEAALDRPPDPRRLDAARP